MKQKYPTVYSLYWNNINSTILDSQKNVYKKFGIELIQDLADMKPHDIWMDEIIHSLPDDEIAVFSDVDAFPLSRVAYERAVAVARNGGVFGLAQTANHVTDKSFIYAGPMFFAISLKTYAQLGRPSFKCTDRADAAQELSYAALMYGVDLHLAYPTTVMQPKWPLANKGVFGLGTFYDNQFFHLFESRNQTSVELFKAVVDDVLCEHPLDFSNYLTILNKLNVPLAIKQRSLSRLKHNLIGFLNKLNKK